MCIRRFNSPCLPFEGICHNISRYEGGTEEGSGHLQPAGTMLHQRQSQICPLNRKSDVYVCVYWGGVHLDGSFFSAIHNLSHQQQRVAHPSPGSTGSATTAMQPNCIHSASHQMLQITVLSSSDTQNNPCVRRFSPLVVAGGEGTSPGKRGACIFMFQCPDLKRLMDGLGFIFLEQPHLEFTCFSAS